MNKPRRRELTPEETADAKRLAEVYRQVKAERKERGLHLTQESLAHECGWGGQSAVSQYTNGRIPINLDALVKLASALDVEPSRISPSLAERIRAPDSNLGIIELAGVMDDEPTQTEVDVPYYREVELAAGSGAFEVIENHGVTKRLPVRALEASGVSWSNAACATVSGDSMMPTLPDGACVAIDTGTTCIIDGDMYAIDHDGMLRIKALYRLPMQRVRVVSFSDDYPDEIVSGDDLQFFRIIGRVFYVEVVLPRR